MFPVVVRACRTPPAVTDMSDPKNKPELSAIELDALVDDLFGWNLRGLKSIWIAFTAPRRYYEAAKTRDWNDQFVPAFRVFFGIMAAVFFFQFFWAGENSATIAVMAQQLEAQKASLPGGVTVEMAAQEYARWNFGLLPVCISICLFLLAAVLPIWGEKLGFVERQRRMFITVIPSTVIGAVPTLAMGLVSGTYLFPLLLSSYGLAFAFDTLTAWRGAFAGKNRLWRALLLAFLLTVMSTIAALLASYGAGIVFGFKYG
jgi:hypothetical protein